MPFLILPHMYECTVYGSFHEQYCVMIDLHSSYNGHPINIGQILKKVEPYPQY